MGWPAVATAESREWNTESGSEPMAGTKQLDLVLINPGSRTQVYQALGRQLAAIENPVWAGLLQLEGRPATAGQGRKTA